MSDYITELETELIRAGHRRQRRRRFRRGGPGRMPGVGQVAVALGAALAVAVAALAILVAGHGRPGIQAGARGNVPAAAEKLVSVLAVLRRPQTAADRALPAQVVRTLASPAEGGRTTVPRLTRLVGTVPASVVLRTNRSSAHVRIFLIVTTPAAAPADPRPRPALGDLVSIAWENSTGGVGVDAGLPAAWLQTPAAMRPQTTDVGYNVGIVPDGVTRLRWTFVDGTVYPTVQHNVALAPSMRSTNVGNGAQRIAVFEPKYLATVTWYGSRGQVIGSFDAGGANPYATWKLIAQINLQPPTPTAAKPAGVAAVYKNGTSRDIKVTVRGLTANTRRNAYAIWLYTSPSHSRLLGFVNPPVRSDGRLSIAGRLPRNASSYEHILITLEKHPTPKVPRKIVLEGTLTLG